MKTKRESRNKGDFGRMYYYINHYNTVQGTKDEFTVGDDQNYNSGNYFLNLKDAEKYLKS